MLTLSVTKIMIIIEAQSNIMSKKAYNGFLSTKKSKLHETPKIKFIPKDISSPILAAFVFALIQAKYNENARKINKVLQATENTQFGGVMDGLIRLYQIPPTC